MTTTCSLDSFTLASHPEAVGLRGLSLDLVFLFGHFHFQVVQALSWSLFFLILVIFPGAQHLDGPIIFV